MAFGRMPGPSALHRIHAHRLDAEHGAAFQPALGDRHAGLALVLVRSGEIGRRVVGDVLALRAGVHHLLRELVEPLAAGGAHRIELPADEHRVVRDVAEQAREDVHVGHARERVLGELREVQHGDLAVLLLHLLGRHARVRWRALHDGRFVATAGSRARTGALWRSACAGARRGGCATGARRGVATACASASAAASTRWAVLENVANRPTARGDAGEPIFVGLELSRECLFCGTEHQTRRRQPCPRRAKEIAAIDALVVLVCGVVHRFFLTGVGARLRLRLRAAPKCPRAAARPRRSWPRV